MFLNKWMNAFDIYEELSTNMKKLNDEQRFIVNDINIYIYHSKPLHKFF
jgi:hypothetical protein